jgi:alkanesulfonate monooxygenase SsuD/methylene tetrahydromethanopterin reductase-like flavin-dependent oxidoreductase (luciferase family)
MKVGVLYDLRNPQRWFQPFPKFYQETLEHMQAMDELGFASISMTEHHFDDDSYCPSVLVWNAAAAVKTKRAMIGQSILILPYAHPVRIAEDAAAIDILSNGRFFLQAGEGYRPMEFEAFGIERKNRAGMTAEALEIIRKCFTEEEFSYEGRHYELKNVRMRPKPVQKPHPPMFLSAQVPGMRPMERVVAMGLNAATVGISEGWEQWYTGWDATVRRHGKDPANFQTSTIIALFVTEDPEQAWHRHREGFIHTAESYRSHSGPAGSGGAFGQQPSQARAAAPENPFMTPDDAVKYLHRVYGKHPPSHLLLWAARPGMSYAESLECHRLFMQKVHLRIRDLV